MAQLPPPPSADDSSAAPPGARLVLLALILVAAVANLNLAVANVALPDIGKAFDAGQTSLNLVAVGYSLGLAASVLYLGALGDRYGRKLMLLLGTALAIPASLLAAFAPSIEVLFAARLLGGLAAGMAYPTTLALITALWSGPARTKSIALWSGLGGAIAALGPLLSGALLDGVRLGLGVRDHAAAGASSRSTSRSASCPPTSTRPRIRSTTSAASCPCCWSPRSCSRSTSRRCPGAGAAAAGLGVRRARRGAAFVLRQRRARDAAVRPRRSPGGGSSGSPRAPGSSSSGR